MWGANRYRTGYTGRSYNVTGGHEAEAKAAEQALDAQDDHLHLHLILVLADAGEMIAAGHAPGWNFGIL